jgi:uncharacterized membrane protein YfcA
LEIAIEHTTLYVLLIVFAATFIRSAIGFGEALVAVPLLAAVVPVRQAAPLAVLMSITVAAVVVAQDWKKIHLRSAAWLVLPTLAGIPVGLLLLTHGPERLVTAILAILILAFAVYSLIGRAPMELKRDSRPWLLTCGFLAGVLGGAYGVNGPPLVIYGAMRRWTAQHFRATLQAYFLPASIVGMAGYWLAGLWTPTVTHFYLLALPAAIPAVFLGRLVNHRMSGALFAKCVYVGLCGVGALLLLESINLRRW